MQMLSAVTLYGFAEARVTKMRGRCSSWRCCRWPACCEAQFTARTCAAKGIQKVSRERFSG
jgi:hypothetical protein